MAPARNCLSRSIRFAAFPIEFVNVLNIAPNVAPNEHLGLCTGGLTDSAACTVRFCLTEFLLSVPSAWDVWGRRT